MHHPPPPLQHTHTHLQGFFASLWTVIHWFEILLKDLKWYKKFCQVKNAKIPVQVFHWYFQPIIRIRLLSSLEQLTNLGFGE